MTHWKLVTVGLAAYVLGLIATAPATLVDSGLQRASQGQVRLAEAQGTLWSGVGRIEVIDPVARSGIGIGLLWRFLPGSLLRGHLVYEVELDQATRRFPVTISPSRIEVANADVVLPAAMLGLGLRQLAPLQLTGDLVLHVPSLSIEGAQVRGAGTLRWQNAGSRLVTIFPLGNYEFQFDGGGSAVRVLLRTLQGPLQLDGGGSWATGTRPTLQITARVLPQQREQLAPMLQLIAVDRGDGTFTMQL